ncbi:cobaltochelatase subunit CobN [Guggenheimella bovis]
MKFLCLVETDDRLFFFKKAIKRLEREYDWVRGVVYSPFELRMKPELYDEMINESKDSDFAFIYFHTGCQNLYDFDGFFHTLPEKSPKFFVSSVAEEVQEYCSISNLNPAQYRELSEYFTRPTEENIYRLLKLSLVRFFGLEETVEPYDDLCEFGIYHEGKVLTLEEERSFLETVPSDLPVIGVLLQRQHLFTKNTKAVDYLIRTLKQQGAFVIAAFVSNYHSEVSYPLDRYFLKDKNVIVDCIITLAGFSQTAFNVQRPYSGEYEWSIFEKYNVPVLKALSTNYDLKQYESLPQGIDMMSMVSNVFQTEMDGQIITVPYASSNRSEDGELTRKIWIPLEERVEKVVALALNYAKLRKKKKKKIAVIFHNLPGNHNIGRGLGLDTFESVRRILNELQKKGYQLETKYDSSQDLAEAIFNGLTNDHRFISSEEMVHRSVALLDKDTLRRWYGPLTQKVKDELEKDWGKFPGKILVENDKILVPGIINGDFFIGIQPSRAFDEKADEIYHSAVFSPPYSYLAYYRWIEDEFHADAILHVGTHGTVEWLPGKEVGMSQSCYPSIALGTLPHYYIYHMGIVGEGIQAKRRSGAVILDHLPPSMDDSGTYEGTEELEELLKEYYDSVQKKTGQTAILEGKILNLAKKTELLSDIHLSEEEFFEHPMRSIDAIHMWLEELKNSVVTDGLHILGQVPEGKLLNNLTRMMVRVQNESVLGLNDAILLAQGYPLSIKENPSGMTDGQLNSVIYDQAVERAKLLIDALSENEFKDSNIPLDSFQGDLEPLRNTLRYVCDEVVPRIRRSGDELSNLLRGFEGEFISPGLGGNPTRGNVQLLPSGRNFYAGDPTMIPSRSAYLIGEKLANLSIEHYMNERGEFPESIAMVIWSGNVIKTNGEDFGEIFSLMGVRPKFIPGTSRVIGVEAIPLEELKRPRIDVILRISGLFRDLYPNLIDLMDDAVQLVCSLDEPHEMNFIKKHFEEDLEKFLQSGIPESQALDQAYARIFGCPTGGYGAGVSHLIENKNWNDYNDISDVYSTWSSNAYSRNLHGLPMKDVFNHRLSTVKMTIKNESTIETDMLSSDDYYSYHGGLIACVRSQSGQKPISLTGHSDNPDLPVVRDTNQETARIMRSRILNPKWLEGLKRHDVKGAQEISKAVDSFFGWAASADVGKDWMFEGIASRFLFDKETREWIESVNPGVVHDVSGKLLEADQRGMWQASTETKEQLQSIYLKAEGLLEA